MLCNRKFVKPLTPSLIKTHPIISPNIQNNTITPSNNVTQLHPNNQFQPQIIPPLPAPTPNEQSPNIPGQSFTLPSKILLALKRLTNFNNPGLRERNFITYKHYLTDKHYLIQPGREMKNYDL